MTLYYPHECVSQQIMTCAMLAGMKIICVLFSVFWPLLSNQSANDVPTMSSLAASYMNK